MPVAGSGYQQMRMRAAGLPEIYGTAASEIRNGADMAFALEPF